MRCSSKSYNLIKCVNKCKRPTQNVLLQSVRFGIHRGTDILMRSSRRLCESTNEEQSCQFTSTCQSNYQTAFNDHQPNRGSLGPYVVAEIQSWPSNSIGAWGPSVPRPLPMLLIAWPPFRSFLFHVQAMEIRKKERDITGISQCISSCSTDSIYASQRSMMPGINLNPRSWLQRL